jgi:ketosteroid isomerase-like protein
MFKALISLAAAFSLWGCAAPPPRVAPEEARQQVMATERAFAKTMADRDHKAFASFLAEDTVFFSGPKPLHGKQAVVDFWARFYQKAQAPFSWEPDEVEVLDSGTLAISSGPVRDPSGKLFARFTSIWRLEAPGQWRIIFDKGNEVCDCPKPPQ